MFFAQNEGKAMKAKLLYDKVWGTEMNDDNRTLKKHISAVRARLEEEGCGYTIGAVYGEGYRFHQG